MGHGVDFEGSNFCFVAPEGREDVVDLPCFTNGRAVVLCVELSKEELIEVRETGKVWVSVLCGNNFYPVFVGSEESVRSVAVDYGGVWKR